MRYDHYMGRLASKGLDVYKFVLKPQLKDSAVNRNVSAHYNIKAYGKSEVKLHSFQTLRWLQ